MLKEDVPAPYENNNKVLITNDYGNLDYSFLEEYTTDTSTNSAGDLIVTDTSGKLDNSFLYSTNSKKANSVVITDASGLIHYNLLKASTTPTASYIPIASNTGKLNNNWLNIVSSSTGTADKDKLVLTGSNGKINNNLLNASTSPAANTIPLSDSNKKISDSWLNTTTTSKPDTILKLDNTGKIDSGVIPNGLFIPLAGGEPSGNIVIQGPNPGGSSDINTLKSKLPNFYGYAANINTDGFLIGINSQTDDSSELIIATHDNGNEPIKVIQYGGAQRYANLTPNHTITLMDANGYTTLLKLTTPTADITTGNISTLNVSGVSTLNGNVNAKSDLTVTGKTTSNGGLEVVGTSNLKGNTSVTGTLSSTGKATLNSLEVTSASTLKGALSVTGASTLTGKLTANGSIGTTSLTTSSTITSSGLITANKGVTVKGAVLDAQAGTKTTTLTATGNTTIGGTLSVTGTTTVNSGLTINNGFLTVNKRMLMTALKPSEFASSVHNNVEPIMLMTPKENGSVSNGVVTLIGGRGNTIIAGGEAGMELYDYTYNTNASGSNSDKHYGTHSTAFNNDGDHLYLIADSNVYVHTGIQANAANLKTFTFSNGGDFSIPRNASISGELTAGSISTGPLTATSVTSSGAVTGTNFTGKWAGYTQDIGTKPSITGDTWILLNNNAKIQHTTISDIISLAKDAASKTNNGYTKLPSGIIIQWGKTLIRNDTTVTINFNQPYFSTVYTVVANMQRESGTGAGGSYTRHSLNTITNTTFSVTANIESGGSNIYIHWIAVGV